MVRFSTQLLSFFTILLVCTTVPAKSIRSVPRDWVPYNEISLDIRNNIAPYCSGLLVEPDWPGLKAKTDDRFSAIQIKAKSVSEDKDKNITASGDVLISQGKIQVEAGTIFFNPAETTGILKDQVYLRVPGMAMESKSGIFQLNTREVSLFSTLYVLHDYNYTGTSAKTTIKDNSYQLISASITPCNPANPDWALQTSSLKVDREKGSAVARNARLKIKGVPVLYMPYLSFPIDNRRQSGFLTPTIELTFGETNYERLQFPYYWNIAPQLDNTFTPLFRQDHGWFFQDETRYLGRNYSGQLDIGSRINRDRWSTSFQHQHVLNDNTAISLSWDDYSDNLVPVDFNRADETVDFSHKALSLTSRKNSINYKLVFDHWQTVDGYDLITEKPYAAQPGISVNQTQNIFQSIKWYWSADITNFNRNLTTQQLETLDQSSGETSDGWRERLNSNISISKKIGKLSLKPELELSLANYMLDTPGLNRPEAPSWIVPKGILNLSYSMDTEDKPNSWSNNFTPKAKFVYAPYTSQYLTPIFDSEVVDFDKDQLFSSRRFTGLDRIGDMNRVSIGFTDSIFNKNGKNKITIDVGQIIRLKPEKLGLTEDQDISEQDNVSPVYGNLNWKYSDFTQLNLEQNWNPVEDRFELQSLDVSYRPDSSALLNFSLTHEWETDDWQDDPHFSALLPIFDRWGFATALDYNFTDELFNDTLIGLEYDGCCWNFRLLSKLNWTDVNESIPIKNTFYLQFYLKGLGQNNEILDDLLAERIPGYQGRLYP